VKARRYQLTKRAAAVVERGHPWIFREQLSSAAQVFRDGEPMALVDGSNRTIAHARFEAHGAIAIRIVRRGAAPPDAAWLRGQLAAAVARRAPLAPRTDGVRLVHGECDGVPAVVVDRFGAVLVATSYATGADGLARFAAAVLARETPGVAAALLRPARRRASAAPPVRTICGAPPALASFTEDGVRYTVDLADGQKTGAYLDLRGLRSAVARAPLAGARVLNLFAYTGMLGRAAEAAGASEIVQVDASARALALAAAHHVTDPARHRFVEADVFAWLPARAPDGGFDLVIVDPPAMTSRAAQVPGVLAAYRRLYRAAARHVRPGGILVAACCTSRVDRAAFHAAVRAGVGGEIRRERELAVELDHPVAFPQADYLKIGWWRRSRAPAPAAPTTPGKNVAGSDAR
jgi:23S rRNA (cytosine1962-C5)-methyltransferase